MFDREKLSTGLVFLSIGVVFLARNLGYIDFYWFNILKLWPVLIIVAGVNLLLPKNNAGNLVSVLTLLVAIGLVVYVGTSPRDSQNYRFSWRKSVDQKNKEASGSSSTRTYFKENFSQEYLPVYEKATLKISGGAIAYTIAPAKEDKLFKADSESTISSHTMEFSENNQHPRIEFSMKSGNYSSNKSFSDSDSETNKAAIELHANPIWDIDLNIGAGKASFDLTHNKVENLSINCGAASITARMGLPVAQSEIDVESGAGSVNLYIPSDAPAKIIVKTGLSSRTFNGFEKIDNGEYVTSGFDSSKDHYVINLKGGLSSFKVSRY